MRKLVALVSLAFCAQQSVVASAAARCDRACLEAFADKYLSAVQAHDPSRVPAVRKVRFTENTVSLKLGQGLWQTLDAPGSYKVYVADEEAGQVAFIGTIRENGVPAILALRLRVKGGKLSEAEAILHRSPREAEALEKQGAPSGAWSEALPEGEHPSRGALIRATDLYFEGIVHVDGNRVPFAEDCIRVLDSTQDTLNPDDKSFTFGPVNPSAMSCRDNMNTRVWKYIHSIEPRRYELVDRERGLVLAFAQFNHPGTTLYADIPGAGRFKMPNFVIRPSSLVLFELFKVQGGLIHRIHGITLGVPYLQPDSWQ